MNDDTSFHPPISEPSDQEIAENIQAARERHGVDLIPDEATRYTQLRKELAWWFTFEKSTEEPGTITPEIAEEFEKARDAIAMAKTEKTLAETAHFEQERIKDELQEILRNANPVA